MKKMKDWKMHEEKN